jgi:hypothetical protein
MGLTSESYAMVAVGRPGGRWSWEPAKLLIRAQVLPYHLYGSLSASSRTFLLPSFFVF